jgi:nitrogen regulatory protein PII
MSAVKRIEIMSDSVELGRLIKALEKSGVTKYTVIRNVAGKGGKGSTSSDLEMTMIENDYLIAFCLPERLELVIDAIKPVLNKFGGACYISDAMEIRSVLCTTTHL